MKTYSFIILFKAAKIKVTINICIPIFIIIPLSFTHRFMYALNFSMSVFEFKEESVIGFTRWILLIITKKLIWFGTK